MVGLLVAVRQSGRWPCSRELALLAVNSVNSSCPPQRRSLAASLSRPSRGYNSNTQFVPGKQLVRHGGPSKLWPRREATCGSDPSVATCSVSGGTRRSSRRIQRIYALSACAHDTSSVAPVLTGRIRVLVAFRGICGHCSHACFWPAPARTDAIPAIHTRRSSWSIRITCTGWAALLGDAVWRHRWGRISGGAVASEPASNSGRSWRTGRVGGDDGRSCKTLWISQLAVA